MSSTRLPNECIRGISNPDCLVRVQGRFFADTTLFCFHESCSQGDGWVKESVNWRDDENVVGFMFAQKKDGEPQFKGGIAIIPLSELDRIKKRFPDDGHFDYERDPIDVNPYHGNLLLSKNIGKPLKNMVRAALALAADIYTREESQSTPR